MQETNSYARLWWTDELVEKKKGRNSDLRLWMF
jgi:hypothetical protein